MLDLIREIEYNVYMFGDWYKVTKVEANDDAKETARKERNGEAAEKLLNLGFMSGGAFYSVVGNSYEGYLEDVLFKVGGVIALGTHKDWFRSSHIVEIIEESDKVKIVKTKNSTYKVEKK